MDHRSRAVEKEVAWVIAHPERARSWAASTRISALAMVVTLALGLLVHIAGYAIGTGAMAGPTWLPADLVATLVSNLGIVLWTSVILVVFLDTLPARARRRATHSMTLAARRLEDRGLPVPDELAGVRADVARAGPTEADPTMAAILERLEAIERRLAEK
jgi:hypothetical protein